MASKRSARKGRASLLASSEPVLFLVDGQPLRHQVPARHLSAGDLAYEHRVRQLRAEPGKPPATPGDDELEAIAEELIESGAFTREAPPAEETTEQPADPAEES